MEELQNAFADLGRACVACATALANVFKSICDTLTPAIKIYLAPNGRVKHLALYGRKSRTRKKNMKRLLNVAKRD